MKKTNILSGEDKKKLAQLYKILSKDLDRLAAKSNVSCDELEKYFIPEMRLKESKREGQNYLYRLASSLQNSGMMRNSIRFNDDEIRRTQIKEVLLDWDIKKARKAYLSADGIYNKFKEVCGSDFDKGSGSKRETNWKKYCKGLFGGLKYLADENGMQEICSLVSFDYNKSSERISDKIKILKSIQSKIHGLGFALTCDWLKECGCEWLAKPDTHVIEVVKHFKRAQKMSECQVVEFVFEWSKLVNVTAYKIDKIIWLLCTGNFYLNKPKTSRSAILKQIDEL